MRERKEIKNSAQNCLNVFSQFFDSQLPTIFQYYYYFSKKKSHFTNFSLLFSTNFLFSIFSVCVVFFFCWLIPIWREKLSEMPNSVKWKDIQTNQNKNTHTLNILCFYVYFFFLLAAVTREKKFQQNKNTQRKKTVLASIDAFKSWFVHRKYACQQ